MQVSTSGEYCPNGCGWNERIHNYRIIPIASDHTEPSKDSKPCPFCEHTALLELYSKDRQRVAECLWNVLLNDLYEIARDTEDHKEIWVLDHRVREFIRATRVKK